MTVASKRKMELDQSSASGMFLQKHWQKLVALGFWMAIILAFWWYSRTNDLTPSQVFQQLLGMVQTSFYGPLIYIAIYAIRPLIFFSAVLLTLAGGYLFGPIWGAVLTIVGSNLSAMIAYTLGRYLGKGLLDSGDESGGLVQRYAQRMRDDSFATVLLMRLLFLPYDLVNYLSGFLRIDWKSFLLATVIGSVPGTISFVLAGASIEKFDGSIPKIDPATLVLAAVILVASLVISQYFKRREGKANKAS